MLARCNNPASEKYPRYGGRGIQVCERWSSFENFLADMGERPDGLTLDRYPNRNGNYEPSNCRWATAKEQNSNRDPFVNQNTLKTHCPAGHEYTPHNTRVDKRGHRKCKQCEKDSYQSRKRMK